MNQPAPTGPFHTAPRQVPGSAGEGHEIGSAKGFEALRDVLPTNVGRDASGRTTLGGCAIADLVAEHGTPAVLADQVGLREGAREYLRAFRSRHADTEIYFASKALPCPAVAGLFAEEGLGCDVASAGELALALAGGVPAERILLHGNAKTDVDIRAALDAGVGLIVIDSPDEVERLERLVDRPQPVLVRVNPGIRADTSAAVATGDGSSKFGVPLSQVPAMLADLRASHLLEYEGLHVHIGSQIFDLDSFAAAAAAVAGLGPCGVYDLGGGLGVRFLPGEGGPSIDAYAERVVAAAHQQLGSDFRLIIEPGRSLVARAAVTTYRVVSVKEGEERTFVAVDGGMGDNLLPRIDGTRMAAFVLDSERPSRVCDIVGPHCESGDRLVADAHLCGPRVGDVIVVAVTGAYATSLANNYNGMPRPPLLLCGDGRARVATRRETFEDLLLRHTFLPAPVVGPSLPSPQDPQK